MEIKPLTENFFQQATSLYESAFPKEERRPINLWQKMWKENERFHIDIILLDDGETFVGLLSYWLLGDFVYVEHFATMPCVRGRGLGGEVVSAFMKRHKNVPILLEVELPHTPLAIRRIAFYQRQGFTLLPFEYLQPPYNKGDAPLPLQIMCTRSDVVSKRYDEYVNTLHHYVYNVH